TREQRVATVVAGADEKEHPSAVPATEAVVEQAGTAAREPGGGALHQGTRGKRCHQRLLSDAYARHPPGRPHASAPLLAVMGAAPSPPSRTRPPRRATVTGATG